MRHNSVEQDFIHLDPPNCYLQIQFADLNKSVKHPTALNLKHVAF